MKKTLIFILLFVGTSTLMQATDFAVRVPGRTLQTYDVLVDEVVEARHHNETSSFACFVSDFSEPQQVEVTWHGVAQGSPIQSVRIRPLSLGILPTMVNDSTFRFTLTEPRDLSIEVNGDIYHNLQLFVTRPYRTDVKKPKPSKRGPNLTAPVIVFPAGKHILPSDTLFARSGQTIIVEDGAWVEGTILCDHVRNVRIVGPGVVRPKGRGFGVEIRHSRQVRVEDIVTTQVPTGGSDSVTIEGVRCITNYGWGDGLNIFASSHVTLRNCFCRTSDDCMTVYATRKGFIGGCEDILVEGCTFWADVAHPIMIGLHGAASYEAETHQRDPRKRSDDDVICDTIRQVTFRNIDILEQNERQVDYQGCMAIICGDNNVIEDITFDDIRVDRIRQGALLALRVFQNEKYCQAPGQCIQRVLFRDIQSAGGGELSIIEGYDVARRVSNISFVNLQVEGIRISDDMPTKPRWYKTTDMCRMLLGSFVDNVRFE